MAGRIKIPSLVALLVACENRGTAENMQEFFYEGFSFSIASRFASSGKTGI
jgi:hypothetical protein